MDVCVLVTHPRHMDQMDNKNITTPL